MEIAKLNFKDFRNYINLTLELNPKVNIFIGDNAQGKTNLLKGFTCPPLENPSGPQRTPR